ncbi:hexosaminidase [Sediminihabitans luteus]|uniref:beta-N-acetylhexosaminidase n=1 Tax=Sediminihabitans luteus TaxID=1138585 RepID=A0A2M9CDH1_9CELL|nr:hexosaminidase [Sediminihabitans luteus]GII99263.1 beta-N-acetylhexosaminidase [Sediminihabitans luteus]
MAFDVVVHLVVDGPTSADAAPGRATGTDASSTAATGTDGDAPATDAAPATRRARRLADAHDADARWADAPAADVTFRREAALPAGGYRLTITPEAVRVDAADLDGAHAATQTLRQLAGPQAYRAASGTAGLTLPALTVTDHPRFGWRGVLLDVARHFLPKADVLRFVDLAAAHKLNVLQLHLTDDQGWRVEIQRYPRLTSVGGWRTESGVGTWRAGVYDGRPHGGFYTQADLREIVAYARERGITVVPEIDVPGHVEAAVAAYPELGTRKEPHAVRTTWGVSTEVLDPSEESLAFFAGVLSEVMDVFDGPWVALGGDEVPTALWRANPEIVARAAELGLDDVADLHGWFLGRLSEVVTAAGRRPIVWDEGFSPRLPREGVVTSWRGLAAGAQAMVAGHDVVMAPEQVVYLDHRASDRDDEPIPAGFVNSIERVLAFDPLPPEVAAEFPALSGPDDETGTGSLLGGQAEVWTEYLDSARRVDYAAFPRLAAFAEAVWSPATDRAPGSTASDEFLDRLREHHLPRLDAAGVEYRPLDGPLPWQTRPGVQGYPRDLEAEMAEAGWAGAGGWREDADGNEVGDRG